MAATATSPTLGKQQHPTAAAPPVLLAAAQPATSALIQAMTNLHQITQQVQATQELIRQCLLIQEGQIQPEDGGGGVAASPAPAPAPAPKPTPTQTPILKPAPAQKATPKTAAPTQKPTQKPPSTRAPAPSPPPLPPPSPPPPQAGRGKGAGVEGGIDKSITTTTTTTRRESKTKYIPGIGSVEVDSPTNHDDSTRNAQEISNKSPSPATTTNGVAGGGSSWWIPSATTQEDKVVPKPPPTTATATAATDTTTTKTNPKAKPAATGAFASNSSPPTSPASSASSSSNAVQVYLRLRPLIAEEEGHELMDYKIERSLPAPANNGSSPATTTTTRARIQLNLKPAATKAEATTTTTSPKNGNLNPNFAKAPPLRGRQNGTIKKFDGYTNILEEDVTNSGVFETTVKPLIAATISGSPKNGVADGAASGSACVFTYGHTGSGKSHTLLGYIDKPDAAGLYRYAAADLFQQLQEEQQSLAQQANVANNNNNNKCLLVRVTELYKDQVRDLISGNECSIRQDSKGIVRVRGPMVEDFEGRIDQQPLGRICTSTEDVVDCVEQACIARRVGTSTHHDQSSRSHLIIEMEIVTSALVNQRNLFSTYDSQLNRLRWLQTERMYKGEDRPMPKWTLEYSKSPQKLRKDIQLYEQLTKESQQQLMTLTKQHNLGGTLVFCDLAGNEYARDAADSTKEELEEAAEINKSLLAVKETIRSLRTIQKLKEQQQQPKNGGSSKNNKNSHQHVPYRDSKLTMILARHLQTRAVMLAHISPSQESIKKTINTLNYSSMVNSSTSATTATNGKKSTTSINRKK